MNEAWICPACGQGNAPHVEHCNCDDKKHKDNDSDIEELFDMIRPLIKPILKKIVEKI
jgi:hypothetical protein